MLPESKIGIGLKLFGEPLPQGLALHRRPAGDLVDIDVPRKASSLEPALDGRHRDPEELCDLLSANAAVYCGERLQSKVFRIGVHGPHFRAGPLFMQTAVRRLGNTPKVPRPSHAKADPREREAFKKSSPRS